MTLLGDVVHKVIRCDKLVIQLDADISFIGRHLSRDGNANVDIRHGRLLGQSRQFCSLRHTVLHLECHLTHVSDNHEKK